MERTSPQAQHGRSRSHLRRGETGGSGSACITHFGWHHWINGKPTGRTGHSAPGGTHGLGHGQLPDPAAFLLEVLEEEAIGVGMAGIGCHR